MLGSFVMLGIAVSVYPKMMTNNATFAVAADPEQAALTAEPIEAPTIEAPRSPTPVPSTAVAPPKPLAVMLLAGLGGDTTNVLGDAKFQTLVARLRALGVRTIVGFTYNPLNPMDASARALVGEIERYQGSYDLRVAGFSLGGLIAYHAVSQGARPRTVLAIDSPLQGRDLAGTERACQHARSSSLLLGAAGALTNPLGAGAGAGLLATGRWCPDESPIYKNLEYLAAHPEWRATWRATLAQSRVRLGAIGNYGDCLYNLYLCMKTWGKDDINDIGTQWAFPLDPGSPADQWSWNYGPHNEQCIAGALCLADSHAAILAIPEAVEAAARFLTQ